MWVGILVLTVGVFVVGRLLLHSVKEMGGYEKEISINKTESKADKVIDDRIKEIDIKLANTPRSDRLRDREYRD